MMKILIISVIVLYGWYANQLYKEQHLPFIQNGLTDLSTEVQKNVLRKMEESCTETSLKGRYVKG
jgi:hypothetical protein